MFKSIAEAVQSHARLHPEKLAVADACSSCTYGELQQKIWKAAEKLKNTGVLSGDSVLVECTQDVDFLIMDLACQWTGAVFVPVEKNIKENQLQEIAAETKAKYIFMKSFCEKKNAVSIRTFLKEAENMKIKEREWKKQYPIAEILFTTGTTGSRKGVVLSHEANVAIAENIQYGTEMSENTVELVPLPLSHSHGLRTCYAGLFRGSSVVLTDGILNVALFFQMIREFHVTALDLSPTLAKLMLKIAGKGLAECSTQIEYIEIGTAFLDDALKEQLRNLFPDSRLYNFYGSTEAGRCCVADFNKLNLPGCTGYPAKNAAFLIVDEKRKPIKSSRERTGLLAVRGSMLMNGYLNNPGLTETILSEGILYTNDTGYMDDQGRIYVLGRKGDLINYKGIKISPEEIEEVAVKYPKIRDCACVPVEDSICGQVPKLYVEVGADYDRKEFAAFLRKNLEQSRIPAFIETVDRIPRSANGKLQRNQLRGNC